MKQEQIMKLQIIEQEAEKFNQQLKLIEENLSEFEELKSGLEELEKNESKEILANLGKKIYIPVEIKDKNLIVEVGQKTFVKKTIPEARKIIEEQIEKFNFGKEQITRNLEALQAEAERLVEEIESEREKEKKGKKKSGDEE